MAAGKHIRTAGWEILPIWPKLETGKPFIPDLGRNKDTDLDRLIRSNHSSRIVSGSTTPRRIALAIAHSSINMVSAGLAVSFNQRLIFQSVGTGM